MTTIQELIEKQTTINENVEKVYQAGVEKGKSQGGDISKFGTINEVSGNGIVTCDYVNENPHNVEVQLSSETITDFSGVEVKKIGKNLFDVKSASDINNWYMEYAGSYPTFAIPVKKGVPITVSYSQILEAGLGMHVIVSKTDGSDEPSQNYPYTWLYHSSSTGLIKNEYTFTPIDDVVYIGSASISVNNTEPLEKFIQYIGNDLQIEFSSYKTDYEPYTEEIYIANADGTVDGITSISPVTNLICEGVNISAKYYCVPNVEWHKFWDDFMQCGNSISNMTSMFSGAGWNKVTFKPKYDIAPAPTATSMFQSGINSTTTDTNRLLSMSEVEEACGIKIDLSKAVSMGSTFRESVFKEINVVDLKSATNGFGWMFYYGLSESFQIVYDVGLKRINRLICYEKNVFQSNVFQGCYLLEYVGFEGVIANSISLQWCKFLQVESAKKLILCLKDYKGTDYDMNYTVSLHNDVWTLLSEEGETSPNNNSWEQYVLDKGWNKA